ncbi:glyoxal oxidase N-terminus-domain-containing protein [Phellopilus nigrolimitatus]|nr:glyoxal oxidase N-terminus-domain-containing protein [Phellopilus nigrolimitatus]
MISRQSWLAAWLLAPLLPLLPALAQTPGSIVDGGDTQISAMMMFVGNDKKVYMLDKSEGNAAQINGHPAWGSVWDFETRTSEVIDVVTNVFCASGMHLPNGSFITLGGNAAIGPTGALGSVNNGYEGTFDATYQDYDGRKAIRVIKPCTGNVSSWDTSCQWFDNPAELAMQKNRWYSAAEPLGDGSVAIIGGFVNGGYINRNYPNTDPATEGGAAEPTYEIYPSKGTAAVMQFMVDTSGLNAYAHTFLMASGKMLVQANVSTMLWDPLTNQETRLQNMPGNFVRVYPASGATAMLPLTPQNNYSQTVIFCGGNDMPDSAWGDYSFPAINTWDYPATKDCQRLTPEPVDGSTPAYEQDDDMLDARSMGQFIALPDGTLLVVNGGRNGTAGYAQATGQTPNFSGMAYGESLCADPAFTPAIYNPNAAKGSRWSDAGLQASTIARLYHSSAILLPDASVLIAGSNPNVDVNTSTIFPTTYKAEIFYPPYFGSTRPVPTGVPTTLTYGGSYFNVTIPASSYSGSANDAAANTTVWVMRQGFTTHAMNMGQRAMALNSTYTVNQDGSFVLHVSQPPPNPNLLQPGPVFIHVTVKGIPSNGTYAIVGSGDFGTQPTQGVQALPNPVRLDSASGSAGSNQSSSGSGSTSSTSHTGAIIGGIVGAVVVIGAIGAIIGICMKSRKRNDAQTARNVGGYGGGAPGMMRERDSDATMMPLQDSNWAASSADLRAPSPYKDYGGRATPSGEFDPYTHQPMGRPGY